MKTNLLDRVQKDLRSAESLLGKQKEALDTLLNKYYETEERVEKLRKALDALQGAGTVLGSAQTASSRIRGIAGADSTGPVQDKSWAPPDAPKLPSKSQVVCKSCGSVDSLFKSTRNMSSGKQIPVIICEACKAENTNI